MSLPRTCPLLCREQFVVDLRGAGGDSCGLSAIVPLVQVAGTVTRRAVEPTWLTASNAKVRRPSFPLRQLLRDWVFVCDIRKIGSVQN